jgi:hypothetical protein
MNTVQKIIQIPIGEIRSKQYENNIDKYGDHSDTCFICGKRIKTINKKYVQYLTTGEIISTDQEVENSQGFFPVGIDCAKKLVIQFTF